MKAIQVPNTTEQQRCPKKTTTKIKDLKEENEKLKSSISIMQSDITDKNSRIAQLDGIKRYFKGMDDGKEKDTENKRPKIDESRDEYVEVDKADKGSEGSNSLLQSTQNDKTNSEDELEEMLNKLENGAGVVEHTNDPKTAKISEIST